MLDSLPGCSTSRARAVPRTGHQQHVSSLSNRCLRRSSRDPQRQAKRWKEGHKRYRGLQTRGALAKPADLTQDVSDSLEKVLKQHADRIFDTAKNLPSSKRYLLAIAGAPGSGKTSSAYVTCHLLNELGGAPGAIAAVLPMDGYHYTREQLDNMEDPKEAHARRGAHWTYDAKAFIDAIEALKGSSNLKLPSFDHAQGDPVSNDIEILQDHKIVIIEGNYVLLDEEPWSSIRDMVDETWFISCPIDTAMDRVLSRQIGNGSDLQTARWRVSNNDRPNAELIEQSSRRATHIIASMPYEDGPSYTSE